jgi:uncharacterized protein
MSKKLIRDTENFVKEKLAHDGSGHDWWHIHRVRENARRINKTEKGDWLIIELATLLHDVGDKKVIKANEDDYSIALNYLKNKEVKSETIENVISIIKHMSFRHSLANKSVQKSKEFDVVQDADRLDAVGAIAVARVFTYGGNRNRPLYNPNLKMKKLTKSNYEKGYQSSLHHFWEKLFLLKDLFNTKSAKKLALKRHKYMEGFVKQFLLEWDGEV